MVRLFWLIWQQLQYKPIFLVGLKGLCVWHRENMDIQDSAVIYSSVERG